MVSTISNMLGGGNIVRLKVSIGRGKKEVVEARVGLFGTAIGVIIRSKGGRLNGMIILPHWKDVASLVSSTEDIKKIKWTPDLLRYDKFASIYDAYRWAIHVVEETYGINLERGEKHLMMEAIRIVTNLNLILLGLRQGNAKAYQERLNRIIDELEASVGENVYNLFKDEALALLGELRSVRDTKGRLNLAAKRALSIAAKSRFVSRANEILKIEPVIAERQRVLWILIQKIEYQLDRTFHYLNMLVSNFDSVMKNGIMRKRAAEYLSMLAAEMEKIDIQPFLFTAMMITKEIGESIKFITIGDYESARKPLTRSLESLILKQIQKEIEELILQLTYLIIDRNKSRRVGNLIPRLASIYNRLNRISEEGFIILTKKDVQKCLQLAIKLLRSKRMASLELTRNHLKKASDCMMRLS